MSVSGKNSKQKFNFPQRTSDLFISIHKVCALNPEQAFFPLFLICDITVVFRKDLVVVPI